ncbi:MAG: sigma-70 region 4 domain-containing protein [Planctomycetota bacterium]
MRERLELHQKVVEAVLEMKEPYRSVVLLHYFDGLNLQQVAARLGRNESTVRTQLHRAHQRLFGRLDSNFGDRATWTAICLPWIFAKEGVLLPPASPLSAAPKAARAASRSKAGLWTTLGVTAVGIAGWQVWARNTGTVAAPLHGDGAAPAVALATGPQDGSDLQAPGEEARVATIAEPVAGATQPVLDVLVTHDGRPAPDTDVWVFSPVLRDASGYASGSAVLDLNWLTRYPYFAMELSLRNNPPRKTDAEGRARIPLPSTWVLVFASNPAGFARVPLQGAFERAGEASPFEVKLENDPEAFVQVADPRGSPLPGIPIEVLADDGAGGWIALGALDSAEPDGHLRFGGFRTIQPAARYGLRAQIPGRINEIHPLETNPVQIAVHPVGRIEWSWPHDGESTASPTGIAYLTALDSTGTPVGETAAKRFAGFRGTFPAVEPGRQFELRLEAVEPGRTLIWTGAGPAVPGATERVQFREQGGTQIRGRLAGAMPPGAAQTQLPRYPFQFQLLDDAGHLVHEIRFLPDAEHAFHIALPLESDWPQPLHAEILSNWATGGNPAPVCPCPTSLGRADDHRPRRS